MFGRIRILDKRNTRIVFWKVGVKYQFQVFKQFM